MNRTLLIAAAAVALGSAGIVSSTPFWPGTAQSAADRIAATRTTTFTVENLTCALCPLTMKTAMQKVAGVRSVEVDFARRTATVVFDPSVTSAEAIAAASTDAGYPAHAAG